MKTELIHVNETRKNMMVEVPGAEVDAEIARVAQAYSRTARVPGFRPGKVPLGLVRQRFRDQILNEVARELVPRAVDDGLRELGVEPVDRPEVRDLVLEEGQPLRFTAAFETVPAIDPGDLTTIQLRKPPVTVEADAVEQALEGLRQRAARFEPVEGRGVGPGDTVVVDLERRALGKGQPRVDRHERVSVDMGSGVNPPGFDEHLFGLSAGSRTTFRVHYPADHSNKELAGSELEYAVLVQAVKRRVVPPLDDELAKDLGDFATLDALRVRVRESLVREAEEASVRDLRADLMKQLARRVPFEVPGVLIDREVDHRVEDFIRRLIDQQIDPRRAGINWDEFRAAQREPASEAVRAALVLDEIARREGLSVSESDVTAEVERYAERTGRTPSAVRAQLEKESGLARVRAGLRREKAIDHVLARVTITGA
jgi:trigger factor